MFTGLIQRIGTVKRISRGVGLVLEIAADNEWTRPLEEGESVAVNGVCLTVVHCAGSRFTADVLDETVARTGLGGLLPGSKVNLERALRSGEALGGHIVQGHVDCRGTVRELKPRGRDVELIVASGRVFAAQCVLKGSVTIDGVSLTVSAIGDDFVGVDLIPTTRESTTLGRLKVGSSVNLEGDVIGKYVAKNFRNVAAEKSGGLTEETLMKAGFC